MDEDMETEASVADEASEPEDDSLDDSQEFEKGLSEKDLTKVLTVEDFLHKSKTFMLEHEKQMFMDTIDSDCLVVSAKGIGHERVVANLLRVYSDPANLVLVINAADYEEKYYRRQIDEKLMHESSTSGSDRELNYLLGGIHFISTRILVVDLLKERIPIPLITGIIVLRAHQIIESCQEAFALRLYRQSNKTGFVKAFTNSVDAFTYGYGHIEKVMRNLFVTELFIWPRFHAITRKALKPFSNQLIEMHIPPTGRMMGIQNNILEIMNFLVSEIKRMNRFIDMQEITAENCITRRFHKILQAQLDSVWHQLNAQTKLIIADMKILKYLMTATIHNDAVSFYVTMRRYRTQDYAMNNSGWILLEAAEKLFKFARERVYNKDDEFSPEIFPKWDALTDVLQDEIPKDARSAIENGFRSVNKPIIVLILCGDSRTCYQLNQYLTQGPERFLLFTAMKNDVPIKKLCKTYDNIRQSDIHSIRLHGSQLQNETIQPRAGPSTAVKANQAPKAAPDTADKKQTKLTDENAKTGFLRDRIAKRKEAENNEFGADDEESKPVDELAELTTEDLSEYSLYRETYVLTVARSENKLNETGKSDKAEKSGEPNRPGDPAVPRVPGVGVEPGVSDELGEANEPDELGQPDVPDESGRLIESDQSNDFNASGDTSITTNESLIHLDESVEADLTQMTKGKFESFAEMEALDITQIIQHHRKPIVCIQTFKTGEDGPMSLERTLEKIDPNYVIMYHNNATAIRQIEVFEARRRRAAADRMKVFSLIHGATIEEQMYLTELKREKNAFDMIIDTKSRMIIPEHQDGKKDDSLIAFQKVTETVENSRQAGGQQSDAAIIPRIIVDMREFRSDLPCLIHRRGIQVIPVTITIGDYILTPDICVERKSISDLIGSLNSGRLYTQCIQMTRHYKKSILLIEFDQNKPFHLQGNYMISGEKPTSNKDITQKLQLLTIHFPRLRLVWSPSPYATAQLFDELKQGKIEPDPVKASALGSDENAKDLEMIVDRMNTNIYDFLLKLPGINTKNVTKVMSKVKNMKELVKLSQEELVELLGTNENAKLLWEIIHKKHKPVEEAPIDKSSLSKWKFRGKGRRF